MEDDAPQPRPSGVRPPGDPPTESTVGFSPSDPDDDRLQAIYRWLLDRADLVMRQRDMANAFGEAGASEPKDADGSILALVTELPKLTPAELISLKTAVEHRRQMVREQIDLEKLVRAPRRSGRLPHWADEDLISGYERYWELLGTLVAEIDSRLAGG